MDTIQTDWNIFKSFVDSRSLPIQYIEEPHNYWLVTQDNWFRLSTNITKTKTDDPFLLDFESNYKANANKNLGGNWRPLASVRDENGKKLFARVIGLPRVVVANNQTHIFNYTVPYIECKFDEVEIIGCKAHDIAELKILDDASGTVSTIPNYQLNQFGFSVNLREGSHLFEGKYPSTLFYGLVISIEYTNLSGADTHVSLNLRLHEMKD